VYAVQASGRDALAHSARAQPQVDELVEPGHAVLGRRKLRDSNIQRRQWFETVLRGPF
jgi:hypothetical protein